MTLPDPKIQPDPFVHIVTKGFQMVVVRGTPAKIVEPDEVSAKWVRFGGKEIEPAEVIANEKGSFFTVRPSIFDGEIRGLQWTVQIDGTEYHRYTLPEHSQTP